MPAVAPKYCDPIGDVIDLKNHAAQVALAGSVIAASRMKFHRALRHIVHLGRGNTQFIGRIDESHPREVTRKPVPTQ